MNKKNNQRLKIDITGRVQGVGFRPTVYRIAKELNLTGNVFNHAAGVTVEVQGVCAHEFVDTLTKNLPPLAYIDTIYSQAVTHQLNEIAFEIVSSQQGKKNSTNISPDVCICPDCLHELFDSDSRFFYYPFLNCTNCGPRLTIIRDLPYDRCKTTMDAFPLCDACQIDYSNPENRRYHAQPTACSRCGPQLSMSIEEMVKRIQKGEILAIKSLGGYQLVCDATNTSTVKKLRERKQRDDKPFALMVLNINSLKTFVKCSEEEEKLLTSWMRPIVLLEKKNQKLSDFIAPELTDYGVMLPYTPLHYLLFNGLVGCPKGHDWLAQTQSIVLIVTSANPKNSPIITDDQQAIDDLKDIADAVVNYDRKILTRVDDSVMRVINKAPYFIRRARGFAPMSIKLSCEVPQGLAVGGFLKNTFCITRGNEAFVSQYIGDLDNKVTIEFFHESLKHALKVLDVKPEYIAHDMHPNFYTTQFAKSYGVPNFTIQHHHAHLASVIAEQHIQEPVIGLALDGYGYGEKGESWGGELLLLENCNFQRLGHLHPLLQPGGDIAARENWRMAASVLFELENISEIKRRYSMLCDIDLFLQMLTNKINSPLTSSAGRLFDAASALLNVRDYSSYEGQAAMILESLVTKPEIVNNGWTIQNHILNLMPTMKYLLHCDRIKGANFFHGTLIAALTDWIVQACNEKNIKKVVLSGGCFLNKILTEGLIQELTRHQIEPYVPRQLPPNDGGISLGQLWIAAQKYLNC